MTILHIPKTGGSSLAKWLVASKKFSVCPAWLWSSLLTLPKSELDQYTLYGGHFYRYLATYLNHSLATFTFLRNPFDRSVSHYEHILRDRNHYFHERANAQGSFIEFLRDPVTRPLIQNYQVRSLSAIFYPNEILPCIEKSKTHEYFLEEYLETANTEIDDSNALILAKDYLTRCFFVGITEHMGKSSEILKKKLGIRTKLYVEHVNANPSNRTVDFLKKEEWKELAKLLPADWELYEYGFEIFNSY